MSSTLYGWGSYTDAQLGPISTDGGASQINKPLMINWPPPGVGKNLVKLACGYQHTLVLDSEGLVYSVGSNAFGQLGHNRERGVFHKVSGIKERVRDVVAGPYHSAAITTEGRVYMWGCNTNCQLGRVDTDDTSVRLLEFNGGPIVQISLGLEHTIALTASSSVYTWGANSMGQLGLGYVSPQPRATPQEVACLSGLPVRQVVAGGYHNFLVTPSGSVYAWGANARGQLGFGEVGQNPSEAPTTSNAVVAAACEPTPHLLKNIRRRGVVFAACGEAHSALLTKDGAVFTFGDGKFGQLGHGTATSSASPSMLPQPQQVAELMGDRCVQVWCGRRHTLVLVSNPPPSTQPDAHQPHPRAVVFGCGADGQLGVPDVVRAYLPIAVKGPWSSRESSPAGTIDRNNNSGDMRITSVFSGGDHSFALVRHSGLSCPLPQDFRNWRPCYQGNVATFAEPLVRRYVDGLPVESQLRFVRRPSQRFSSTAATDISEATYTLESYNMQSAFARLETAFGSIGCLASSLLVDNSYRSHYTIGRADHGMDLDAAHILQTELFLVAPVNGARGLIRPLLEAVSRPRSNFPDAECLRALLFLAVSPLLETQRYERNVAQADGPTAAQLAALESGEQLEDWYPTLAAGYGNGFVLVSFCRAVCRLDDAPASILDAWFLSLQPRFFRRLVANLNNFVAYHCSLKQKQDEPTYFNLISGIHAALELMKRLREINDRRSQPISYTAFYVPEMTERFDMEKFGNWLWQRQSNHSAINSFSGQSPPPRRFRFWRSKSVPPKADQRQQASHQQPPKDFSVFDYAFVFDVTCKAKMLQVEAKLTQYVAMRDAANAIMGPRWSRILRPLVQGYLVLDVTRENLIGDTLYQLGCRSPADLKRPLKVRFRDEEAIDDGGVLKEFFLLIIREILNPVFGMFRVYTESRLLWFNESNLESPTNFKLVGALCGLAIYNSIIVDLGFPTALFKKLLDQEPTLEDLKELDPVVASSLQSLLDYEGSDVEDVFCLTFEVGVDNYGEVRRVELMPGGADVVVTQENKAQYVESYLDFRFNRSCEDFFNAFKNGFFSVCSGYVIKMFQPSELRSMVVGSDDVDWQELRRNTNYQGEYWDQHPVIQWFWEVLLNECTLTQKKDFLRFLTGCDRIPIEGLPGIKITIQPNGSGDDFLPAAHTCYNILDLPKYSSKEILSKKFMQAIENTEGFGLV